MMRRALPLAAALSLGFAAAASAGQPVFLREGIADDDGQITLADLFEGAGRAGAVVVSTARPGASTVLDAGQVQRAAMANGLSWANERGLRRVVVRPGAPAASPAARRGVETLTYTRSIMAGETVGPEDLAWTRVAAAPADAPRDAESLIGMVAKRPLRAGSAAAQRDVSAPQVIGKGEMVQVTYSAGGVTLSLQAKALKAAAAGEVVEVVNPASKKVIQVVATAPGQARVGPGSAAQRSSAQFASR